MNTETQSFLSIVSGVLIGTAFIMILLLTSCTPPSNEQEQPVKGEAHAS